MPANDPNYPIPGEHPDPDHKWNKDREGLIQGLKTDPYEEYLRRNPNNREEIDEY